MWLSGAPSPRAILIYICSPVVSQVELPQRAAAPQLLEVARQHVLREEELLERRAPPQRLEPARQLVVPARTRGTALPILPQGYAATRGRHLYCLLPPRAKASRSDLRARAGAQHLQYSACSAVQLWSGCRPPVSWLESRTTSCSTVQPRSGSRLPQSRLLVRKTARSTGAKLWSGSRVPSIELFVRSTPRNALMFASGLRVPVTVTQRKRIGLGLGLGGWGVGVKGSS